MFRLFTRTERPPKTVYDWVCGHEKVTRNCELIRQEKWEEFENSTETKIDRINQISPSHFLSKEEAEKLLFFPTRVTAVAFLVRLERTLPAKSFWEWAVSDDIQEILPPFKTDRVLYKRFIPSRSLIFNDPVNFDVHRLSRLFGEQNFMDCASRSKCTTVFRKLLDECPDLSTNAAKYAFTHNQPYLIPVWTCLNSLHLSFSSWTSQLLSIPRKAHKKDFYTNTKSLILMKRVLGEGSFGVVFEARIRNLSLPVAVKFNKLVASNELAFHLVQRDIQGFKLAQRCPEWIVPMIGTVENDEKIPFKVKGSDKWLLSPGIIMEFLHPRNVRNSLQYDRPLGFCIYIQILLATKAMYEQGIVHEDLHPGNLVVLAGERAEISLHEDSFLKVSYSQSLIEDSLVTNHELSCPRVKFIDGGSLNTLDGQFEPLDNMNALISRNRRQEDPTVFFCRYLYFIHTIFTDPFPEYFDILQKLLVELIPIECFQDAKISRLIQEERSVNQSFAEIYLNMGEQNVL
jgi:Protein kinase domain